MQKVRNWSRKALCATRFETGDWRSLRAARRPLFGARRRAVVVEWIRSALTRWAERKTEVDAHRRTLSAMRRAGYMG